MDKLTHTLQGNSLIEVLVSLSILSLLFGLGINLILQLTGISSPAERFKTEVLLRNVLEENIGDSFMAEEEWKMEGRRFVRSIRPYPGSVNLWEIEVKVYFQDKWLARRTRLTFIPQIQRP